MHDAPTSPGTIVFSGLVDAYFEHYRFHKSTESEFKAYATRRLELLEQSFGVSFLEKLLRARQPVPGRERSSGVVDRDQYQAIALARSSLKYAAMMFSPFGSYLEGGPGPIEQKLWDRHHRTIRDVNETLREQYRSLFADRLLVFYPSAAEQRTTEAWLRGQGLRERPDEDLLF